MRLRQPRRKKRAAIVHERLAPMAERGQGIWVRVNYPDPDQLGADLEAICHPGLGAVCVPKIASPADIAEVDRLITYFEGAAGVPLGTVAIVPLLETAEGIAAPREIFAASDRVRYAGGLAADGADVAAGARLPMVAHLRGVVRVALARADCRPRSRPREPDHRPREPWGISTRSGASRNRAAAWGTPACS